MKYLKSLFIAFSTLAFLLVIGCEANNSKEHKPQLESADYAKGFRYTEYDDYTLLDIVSPWDTSSFLGHFVLTEKDIALPSDLNKEYKRINIPVESVVGSNTTQCENIIRLKSLDVIKAVFEANYIQSAALKERIINGEVMDLGESSQMNIEQVIQLNPSLIFTSPYQGQKENKMNSLQTTLLPYLDYMEDTPLGQVEWIKVIGLLLDKKELADSLFRATEEKYKDLCKLCDNIEDKPTVFGEIKTGSTWYISSGKSYIANMYKDAGADYIFKNITQTGSVPFSEETVLDQAYDADFWLIKHHHPSDLTLTSLKDQEPLYGEFEAYKEGDVFFCNTSKKPYYEEVSLYPDRLLSDLIAIFHPSLLPNHQFYYYQRMAL